MKKKKKKNSIYNRFCFTVSCSSNVNGNAEEERNTNQATRRRTLSVRTVRRTQTDAELEHVRLQKHRHVESQGSGCCSPEASKTQAMHSFTYRVILLSESSRLSESSPHIPPSELRNTADGRFCTNRRR